ncbi:c-type cytochrome [Hydrogenimonas sp.]
MRKTFSLALAGALLIGFAGCGDKKKEEAKETAQSPAAIKVTTGAVKAEPKAETSKENTGQFYYSYNKEKNATREEADKRRTTLDAYLNIRSPYERVQIELMIQKLSKEFRIKCSPCHDDYANGVIGPSLLDKDGDYIYKQLMAFKTGEKKNELMKQLVEMNDPETLRAIAEEIAKFNKQIQEMRKGRS